MYARCTVAHLGGGSGDALEQQRRSVLQLLRAADVQHTPAGVRRCFMVRVLEQQRAAPAVRMGREGEGELR